MTSAPFPGVSQGGTATNSASLLGVNPTALAWAAAPTKRGTIPWTTAGQRITGVPGLSAADSSAMAAHYGWTPGVTTGSFLTPVQAKAMLPGFSAQQRGILNAAMKAAGAKPSAAKAFWGNIINYAQALGQNGQPNDPFQLLQDVVDGNLPGAVGLTGTGGGGGGGPFHQRQTTRSVNLTNKEQAGTLLDQVFSNYLGYEGSDAEKAQFLKSLNAQERAHPTTTVSSTSGTTSGRSTTQSSTSTSSGGTDPQAEAIAMAKQQKDYAEYQYGTTYFNAFLNALGPTVSGAGHL